MKPGTSVSSSVKGLLIPLSLAWVFCGGFNVCAEEMDQVPSATRGRDAQTRKDVLKKKSFYHFFLGEYLTAASDLKLLEADAKEEDDIATLNESRRLLGGLYLAWGMDGSAARLFDELIENTPISNEKTRLLKIVQKMQYDRGLYQAAIASYGLFSTEKGSPGMDQATYFYGMSHVAKGAVQKGIDLLSAITPDSRYFPYAQLTLAKSYFRLNNIPKSLHLFEAISGINTGEYPFLQPFIEKTRLTWGQVLLEVGRNVEARSVLREIPKESPFYSDALFGMAWAAFKNQDDLTALLMFQDLIKRDSGHHYALEALALVGHVNRRLGDYAGALDHYSAAIDIYGKEEKKIRDFQRLIQDPARVAMLLSIDRQDEKGRLSDLLKEDDALRFWVRQYRGLSSLTSYLDQKLRDMAVFQVMVDHREAVFRQVLPSLKTSLEKNPLRSLKKKEATLNDRVAQAMREEKLIAFSSPDEGKTMTQLAAARRGSLSLGAKIKAMGKRVRGRESLKVDQEEAAKQVDLEEEWKKVHRGLSIAEGELIWEIATELPGRADDLKRGLTQLHSDLSRMAEGYGRLVLSAPSLEREISLFRKRIGDARVLLSGQREKTIHLKERLLPVLQALFLRQLKRKLDQIVSWIAVAELSQIQILDIN